MWSVGLLSALSLFACLYGTVTQADENVPEITAQIEAKLRGLDGYMEQLLHDWNGVCFGVGVVAGDQLVFARGYGYRDYGKKLPFDRHTLFAIGSDTKTFTAIAAGMLVEEGRLTWDGPVRESVPEIRFHDTALTNSVTLRDMLAHRTGITRHDAIWYDSGFTGQDLFDRLRYLEPSSALRQQFIYNNLMYAAVGHIIESKSGMPWKDFLRGRLFEPLQMSSTTTGIGTLQSAPNAVVPYAERKTTGELYPIPIWQAADAGLAPAGAIVSNFEDLSHWLIALMNDGRYAGRQVLPPAVLKATMEPAIPVVDTDAQTHGWSELQNLQQGMGRRMGVYRGHLITYHGGGLPGFYSQVSYLPAEKIGVLVVVIGDHAKALRNTIGYHVYERLLRLEPTPWSERLLDIRRKERQAERAAPSAVRADRVPRTKPSHALSEYAGEYEHPAYGPLTIVLTGKHLSLDFHQARSPLNHYHYDRFDTADADQLGRYSLNFSASPRGDIDRVTLSLDDAAVTFVRRPERIDPQLLASLAGSYADVVGLRTQVTLQPDHALILKAGDTSTPLIPYQGLKFRIESLPDVVYEFTRQGERTTALKRSDPRGERVSLRQ